MNSHPQFRFYTPEESVVVVVFSLVFFSEARRAQGMRHMSCTAGASLGGSSPPYAQHALCPI